MAPTIGRIVHVLVDSSTNNGSDIAPAVITRVWSGDGQRATVNYRILGDHSPSEDQWKTSATLFADESAARDALVRDVEARASSGVYGDGPTGMHAFWPPRS